MLAERAAGWLLGKVQFAADGGAVERLLNRCSESGLTLAGLCPTPTGVTGWMLARDYRRIHRAAVHCHCRVHILRRRGLPFFLRRWRGRWGLPAGAAVFLALCLWLPGLLWCVRFYRVPASYQREIRRALYDCGIIEGCRPGGAALRRARQQILLRSQDLADVSLNFVRGRLVVEVSLRTPQPAAQRGAPGDIVAARAGIIERISVQQGFAVVAVGQQVSAGELLVTGSFFDDKTGNTVTTAASASVVARTQKSYLVSLPLQSAVLVPDGAPRVVRALLIGGRRIPLGGQQPPPENSIVQLRRTPLTAAGFALPAVLEQRFAYPRRAVAVTLSLPQAEAQARLRLQQALAQDGRTVQMIGSAFAGAAEGGVYRASLTVERLEEIGRPLPEK